MTQYGNIRHTTDDAERQALLRKMKEVAGKGMTPEEAREQTISFIMSSLGADSKVTRAQVEAELDRPFGQRSNRT